MLSHRKPTSSHHNVRQFQSHPQPDKGVFVFSPSFFPYVTTEKGKQQPVQNSREASPPPLRGVWGAGAAVL